MASTTASAPVFAASAPTSAVSTRVPEADVDAQPGVLARGPIGKAVEVGRGLHPFGKGELAAGAGAVVEHGHLRTGLGEFPGGGEAGGTGSHHQHSGARRGRLGVGIGTRERPTAGLTRAGDLAEAKVVDADVAGDAGAVALARRTPPTKAGSAWMARARLTKSQVAVA